MSKSHVPSKRHSRNNNSPNRSRSGPRAKRKSLFKSSKNIKIHTVKPRQFTAGQKYNFRGMKEKTYMAQPDGSLRRVS